MGAKYVMNLTNYTSARINHAMTGMRKAEFKCLDLCVDSKFEWKLTFLYENGLSYRNRLSHREMKTGFPIWERAFLYKQAFLCSHGNMLYYVGAETCFT